MGRKRKVAARNAKKGIDDPKQNRTKAQRKRQKVISPSFDVKTHIKKTSIEKEAEAAREEERLSELADKYINYFDEVASDVESLSDAAKDVLQTTEQINNTIKAKRTKRKATEKLGISTYTGQKKHQAKSSKFERFRFRNS